MTRLAQDARGRREARRARRQAGAARARAAATTAGPWVAALTVAAVTLGACGRDVVGPRGRDGRPLPPGSGVGFSRPPTVDGSRAACLLPPYTPPPDATSLAPVRSEPAGDAAPEATAVAPAASVEARRSREGRRWSFRVHGETAVDPALAAVVVGRLRSASGPRPRVSHGLYCGDGDAQDRLCFVHEGNLCETRVEEAARALIAALQAELAASGVAAPALEVAVLLAGRVGPRCEPSDASCGPVPYEAGWRYDPRGSRTPGPLASYAAGPCRHDGDCVVAGCGNHCVSWEYGGAGDAGTCEGYAFSSPVFCGCVRGGCAWFQQ